MPKLRVEEGPKQSTRLPHADSSTAKRSRFKLPSGADPWAEDIRLRRSLGEAVGEDSSERGIEAAGSDDGTISHFQT